MIFSRKLLYVNGDSWEMGDFGLHIPRSPSPSSIPHSMSWTLISSFAISSSSISSFEVLPHRRDERDGVTEGDICKGNNCGVQFHLINEAYDMVMSSLRESDEDNSYSYNTKSYDYADGCDESFRGMNDSTWDLWEEWMGWEGAGIRDYSSHINPYI